MLIYVYLLLGLSAVNHNSLSADVVEVIINVITVVTEGVFLKKKNPILHRDIH